MSEHKMWTWIHTRNFVDFSFIRYSTIKGLCIYFVCARSFRNPEWEFAKRTHTQYDEQIKPICFAIRFPSFNFIRVKFNSSNDKMIWIKQTDFECVFEWIWMHTFRMKMKSFQILLAFKYLPCATQVLFWCVCVFELIFVNLRD